MNAQNLFNNFIEYKKSGVAEQIKDLDHEINTTKNVINNKQNNADSILLEEKKLKNLLLYKALILNYNKQKKEKYNNQYSDLMKSYEKYNDKTFMQIPTLESKRIANEIKSKLFFLKNRLYTNLQNKNVQNRLVIVLNENDIKQQDNNNNNATPPPKNITDIDKESGLLIPFSMYKNLYC